MYQIKASLWTKAIKSCCVANHLIHLPYHKASYPHERYQVLFTRTCLYLLHSFDDDHIPVHIKIKLKNQKQPIEEKNKNKIVILQLIYGF